MKPARKRELANFLIDAYPVKPREWFLVPLHVIDEAVQRIRDGSITEGVYDPKMARLVG